MANFRPSTLEAQGIGARKPRYPVIICIALEMQIQRGDVCVFALQSSWIFLSFYARYLLQRLKEGFIRARNVSYR